jgi:signal recognition particle subunit SEC65
MKYLVFVVLAFYSMFAQADKFYNLYQLKQCHSHYLEYRAKFDLAQARGRNLQKDLDVWQAKYAPINTLIENLKTKRSVNPNADYSAEQQEIKSRYAAIKPEIDALVVTENEINEATAAAQRFWEGWSPSCDGVSGYTVDIKQVCSDAAPDDKWCSNFVFN